ncbi:MAG: ABC transporter ATP-binding protein [Desulfovibrionaceae bacterium]|nr:ABC transporter ATP-binding protein [Desulfovibrionaceae bacterium]MBF0515174.1 ABC transporter ATP-binding protein [Desulfovibrionaceae bacterium]
MIAAADLRKSYKDQPALRGVSFSVASGELYAYLGPNGAGKTTTIRIMTGLTRPDSGTALVAGRDLLRDPKAKAGVGMVAQTINLDMELTVAENLDIHGRLFGMSRTRRREKAAEWLGRVELSGRADSQVKTLSGGLRRRVMIARALMHEPAALFLDEPTVGLDADIRRQIWALIKDLQASGVAIFLTTHYIEEAEALADRVAFLRDGLITATDTPRNLIEAIGAWAAVDLTGKSPAAFFQERADAMAHAACQAGGVAVRPTSLEDAYLRAMGSGVLEPDACLEAKAGPAATTTSGGAR